MSRGRPAAAWLLCAAGALAAAGAARAETLADAWAKAARHDESLAAAQADVDAAQDAERAARGARWPTLSATGGYQRLDATPEFQLSTPAGAVLQTGPLLQNNELVTGTVQANLPLYTGGRITSGIDAARQRAAGAEQTRQATAASVRLQVAEEYVAVLRARHLLRTAQSSVDSLTAHVADVQRMVDAQTVSMSDLLAARVALANAEQSRVRAANAVELALAAYNRRLGEPLDRVVDLDEKLPATVVDAGQPLAALVARALAARGELKAMAAQADALQAQSRAERAGELPQVALTAAYMHLNNQFLNRENISMVGIGFNWSLFDGGQARHRADALRSEGRAAQRRLADLSSRIELEVRQGWLDVQEARARIAASGQAVAQADENLRMSRELYAEGLATNTQVLEAVALRVAAVDNHDNAQLDESLSRLRLAHAVGDLP